MIYLFSDAAPNNPDETAQQHPREPIVGESKEPGRSKPGDQIPGDTGLSKDSKYDIGNLFCLCM